ncbi:MAG: hypothetical protein COB83_09870 [Gammaproteobacteria bacterium]|nr:MAG: hypothetical protein COB83_09870 [Gammaproteobacteria bacterium]
MDSNSIQISGYQIKEVLGHGGMATVYLAIQESFDRKVAIKIMAEQLSLDPSFKERFLQEAKIVSRLVHPNIVTVYDVRVENNYHYLSMEYIDGVDLKEKLQTISLFHLIKVIKEIALALDYAGRKGYVHRDIKPENIMINHEDGRAVLMDFGIAKAFDSMSEMTQTGTAIGTPYYMSPEQAKGKEIDWRSDIYSLGVVFFQFLTGKLPYSGESAVAVGIMHLTDPIPKLPEFMRTILQPVIDKLMAKSPDDRFQNGEDIINTLNQISDEALIKINEEFTKEGHRDSGEHINYNVSAPISQSGVTSIQRGRVQQDESDNKTKVISITQSSPIQPNTSNNTLSKWLIGIIAIILLSLGAEYYFATNNDSIIAKLLGTPETKSENDGKLDELLQSTRLIEQNLISTKKKESEASISKEKEAQKISAKLERLLKRASIQEKQLTTNSELIDELYQTYQLISLLENDHPKVIEGYETLKTTYIKMIEQQLVDEEIQSAQKSFRKMLRSFPDSEYEEGVISLKYTIDSSLEMSQWLVTADEYLANGILTGSDQKNAYELYNKILNKNPEHEKAQQGIKKISDKFFITASKLATNKQYQKALKEIEIGAKIHPESASKFDSLKASIYKDLSEENAKKAQQEEIEQLLNAAYAQKKQGNLIPPKQNNAFLQYQQVLKLEPSNQAAIKAKKALAQQVLARVPSQIANKNFTLAQQTIQSVDKYFPNNKATRTAQLKLNAAIESHQEAQRPKILNVVINEKNFTVMPKQSSAKLKADRTIYIGFEFANFGQQTKVIQAILYAGSINDKLSTTPVIVTQNSGVKYFKISRPVTGFAEGGYYLNFILKGKTISSSKFSIEN